MESQFRRPEKKLSTLPTLWVKTNKATNLMQVQNVRVEAREVQNIFRKSGQCQLKGHHLKWYNCGQHIYADKITAVAF
jgi:hypothetical protein